ncbi:MAG: hypothetical protein WCT85_02880, partial [Parachlamydiales bacterium]
ISAGNLGGSFAVAVKNGHPEIANAILSKVDTSSIRAALQYAKENGYTEVVNAIISSQKLN